MASPSPTSRAVQLQETGGSTPASASRAPGQQHTNPYKTGSSTFDYQEAAALSMANAQSTVNAAHNIVKQANQTVAAASAIVAKHQKTFDTQPRTSPKYTGGSSTVAMAPSNFGSSSYSPISPIGSVSSYHSSESPQMSTNRFRPPVPQYQAPEVPRVNLPTGNPGAHGSPPPPSLNYTAPQSPLSNTSQSTETSPSTPTHYNYDPLPIVPTGTKMVLVEDAGCADANGDYICLAGDSTKKYVKEQEGMRHEISAAKDKSGFQNWWLYRCDRNGIATDIDYYVVRSNSTTPPLRGWKKLPKGQFPCPKVRYYKKP